MDEENKKNNNNINKSFLLKQVKGFSTFLNNSTSYWKETINDLEKNLCQCGDNEEKIDIDIKKTNSNDNNKTSIKEARIEIEQIITDKRKKVEDSQNFNSEDYFNNFTDISKNNLTITHKFTSSNNQLSTLDSLTNQYKHSSLFSENKNNCNSGLKFIDEINNVNNNINYNNIIVTSSNIGISKSTKLIDDNKNNLNDLILEKFSILDPKKNWTKEEDEILLNFVKSTNSRNWKKISAILKTKTPQQCSYRYNKIFTLKGQRKFTRNEDILIIELIEKFGFDWDTIIKYFPDRKKNEISERYFNKLNSSLKKKEFTHEEDALLLKLHSIHGNNWNEIIKYFKETSINMLKNRFYGHLKKRIDSHGCNNNSNNCSTSTENNFYYYNGLQKQNNCYTNSQSENSDFFSNEFSGSIGHNNQSTNKTNFNNLFHSEYFQYEENNSKQNKNCEPYKTEIIKNRNIYDLENEKNFDSLKKDNLINILELNNNAKDLYNVSNYDKNNNNSSFIENPKDNWIFRYNSNEHFSNIDENKVYENRGLIINNKQEEILEKNYYENLHKISKDFKNNNIIKETFSNIEKEKEKNLEFSQMDYEEFLQDFETIDKINSEFNLDKISKEFLNDSFTKNNYYNSIIEYNNTSLLDLFDDDIFSKDFLSKNTSKYSGDSYNISNESIFHHSKNNSNESPNSILNINEYNKNFGYGNMNILNNFNYCNNNNYNYNTENKSSCDLNFNLEEPYNKNYFKTNSESQEKKKIFLRQRTNDSITNSKMVIDDTEILSIPMNYTKLEDFSPNMSKMDMETQNNFNENYLKCFEKKFTTSPNNFYKSISEEVREKGLLNQTNSENKKSEEYRIPTEYRLDKYDYYNKNSNDGYSYFNENSLKNITPENINNNNKRIYKQYDAQLIKQFKMLQEVYKKYKKFRNVSIKIKTGEKDTIVKPDPKAIEIIEADKILNLKSEGLLGELIHHRKEYKRLIQDIKKSKKIKTSDIQINFNKNNNSFNINSNKTNFLRNSLVKQIEILIKLINTIKIKIDLIKNYNNEFIIGNFLIN